MCRVTIAVLLGALSFTIAHSQFQQLPGHRHSSLGAELAQGVDVDVLMALLPLLRMHCP